MKKKIIPAVFIFFFVSAFVLFAARASPQNKPASSQSNVNLIYSVKGAELYRNYCASCHGAGGKGNGPVAPGLKNRPADLTVLAARNHGKFPAAYVGGVIAGDGPKLLIHGSREMPIWGPIFHQIEEDQDFGSVRIKNLTDYLQSIQQK